MAIECAQCGETVEAIGDGFPNAAGVATLEPLTLVCSSCVMQGGIEVEEVSGLRTAIIDGERFIELFGPFMRSNNPAAAHIYR